MPDRANEVSAELQRTDHSPVVPNLTGLRSTRNTHADSQTGDPNNIDLQGRSSSLSDTFGRLDGGRTDGDIAALVRQLKLLLSNEIDHLGEDDVYRDSRSLQRFIEVCKIVGEMDAVVQRENENNATMQAARTVPNRMGPGPVPDVLNNITRVEAQLQDANDGMYAALCYSKFTDTSPELETKRERLKVILADIRRVDERIGRVTRLMARPGQSD